MKDFDIYLFDQQFKRSVKNVNYIQREDDWKLLVKLQFLKYFMMVLSIVLRETNSISEVNILRQ